MSWGLTQSIEAPKLEERVAPGGPQMGAVMIDLRKVALAASVMVLGHMEAVQHVAMRSGWMRPEWYTACQGALQMARRLMSDDPRPLEEDPANEPAPTHSPSGLWLPAT